MRFKERLAVITGAGSGIGAQTAIRMAKEGSRVLLVGRTKSKLEKVANQINENSVIPVAEIFPTDVTNEEDVTELAEYIRQKYGDLHVLVNNAGGSGMSKLSDLSVEEWDRIQNMNTKSVFLVSKILGKVMTEGREQELEKKENDKDRSIVNVASLSGHKPGAQIPHYSVSKAAVINLTKALALEYAPFHIRVNSVSPGFVETPLTEKGLQNKKFEESIKRNTALGRVGKPEEIANIISFISSPEATYMTGTDVLVDGGWLIK